jgi:hypothetical protein
VNGYQQLFVIVEPRIDASKSEAAEEKTRQSTWMVSIFPADEVYNRCIVG